MYLVEHFVSDDIVRGCQFRSFFLQPRQQFQGRHHANSITGFTSCLSRGAAAAMSTWREFGGRDQSSGGGHHRDSRAGRLQRGFGNVDSHAVFCNRLRSQCSRSPVRTCAKSMVSVCPPDKPPLNFACNQQSNDWTLTANAKHLIISEVVKTARCSMGNDGTDNMVPLFNLRLQVDPGKQLIARRVC